MKAYNETSKSKGNENCALLFGLIMKIDKYMYVFKFIFLNVEDSTIIILLNIYNTQRVYVLLL